MYDKVNTKKQTVMIMKFMINCDNNHNNNDKDNSNSNDNELMRGFINYRHENILLHIMVR